MEKLENLRGVCSQCQTSKHKLERLPNGEIVLEQHECCGEHCTGSGMAPETTYKK